MHYTLSATPHGLMLGGIMLAKREADNRFCIAGREQEIRVLLEIAYGRPVSAQAMRYIKRGGELMREMQDKDWHDRTPHDVEHVPVLAKVSMMLALAGLNGMEASRLPQLAKAAYSARRGMPPERLLKRYAPMLWKASVAADEDDDDEDSSDDTGAGGGNYNPDEPRVPAGQPGGGQWTTGGGGAWDKGSIVTDDIRTAFLEGMEPPSSLLQGTQVAEENGAPDNDDGSLKPHVLQDPLQYLGMSFPNAKGNTECVAFAQQAAGAPLTRDWVAGDFISPSHPPAFGTWVATFNNEGNYYGHVGAFSHFDDKGTLYLYDQFNSKGQVTEQPYRARPPGWQGRISNNPANYRILLW